MKRLLISIILLYCFISLPFHFGTLLFGSNGVIIKYILALILLIYRLKINDVSDVKWLFGILGYFILHCAINSSYTFQVLLVLPDFLFAYSVYGLIKKYGCVNLFNVVVKIALFISASIVISKLCFEYTPSLFSLTQIDDYPVYFNPFLGSINPGKDRPCWYFAEPSYSGFFIGIILFILKFYQFKDKKARLASYACIIAGILCTASMGTYAYLLLSFPLFFLNDKIKNKKLWSLLFLFAIVFVYGILATFDLFSIEQSYFDLASHGADNRQERMLNAESIIAGGSLLNHLFGNGIECVVLTYKEGISDAYHKLYCENGLLFTIPFLLLVRKLTLNNLPVYVFILLSFFSIIIHLEPIIFVLYYLVYFVQFKTIKNKNESTVLFTIP